MNTNADGALGMFKEGYNCAQSVLAACGRRFGFSREQACHVAQTFGSGMCGLNQTCGAVTGALMAIGLKHGKTTSDDAPKTRAQQLAHEFARRFIARNGSIGCTQLLGHDLSLPGEVGRVRALGLFQTICPRLVSDAVEITDELLKEE